MSSLVGRRVVDSYHRESGVVIKWEPLSAAMCDALVRLEDGREVWFGSSGFRPIDDLGPLPTRTEKILEWKAGKLSG